MGLLSFFKRSAANPPAPAAAPESVEQARARARHRLIGAAVLVLIGVIGFPLLFETQPRPIPVDLPIEIPQRDGAPPLAVPAPKPAPEPTQAPAPAERSGDVIDESAAEAGREVAADPTAPMPAPRQETARAEPKPAAATPPKPEPSRPEPPKPSATDAARARALLEGRDTAKPAAAASDSRFIVQVGAYSETGSARDMRLKVEKLGLKTYTQVIDTGSGKRVRVRVGPFASREEADRAAAKLKAAGLPSAVLTL
ncbi:SPOR domain-containing protein [Schlegelella sp. S2-27]|uniref:SPOR domain-containing protein n=1 Tax=Caldimonas mangrovi TaxID=2944811 RepID=A0ABT0YHK4_9BURK|nr:SPOR domain-containing protein [Caldimonas mangrovi]MCM5678215.1 SPOR domain-containing protein [Caldimonas mangrovi]